MTIMVDSRTGSAELLPLFPKGAASLATLEYGDFMFFGNGPGGMPCPLGVERKGLKDLLNSMVTGRFSGHQLPGMSTTYQRVYLIVEGLWRYNPVNSILETRCGATWEPIVLGGRRFMAHEVIAFLNTLMIKAGVLVFFSGGRRETVQIVLSLHRWWNDKQWDQHSAHLSLHKSYQGPDGEVGFIRPNLVRRMAAELPGIGSGKSRDVGNYFGSVVEMVMAPVTEWMRIPGVGRTMAQRIVDAIYANKEDKGT